MGNVSQKKIGWNKGIFQILFENGMFYDFVRQMSLKNEVNIRVYVWGL